MSVQVANNAYGTLNAGISAVAASLTLSAGQGVRFPVASIVSGHWFYITIFNSSNVFEIAKVTDKTGDVLTLIRAQDGTAASAFITSDFVELRTTAAMINDLKTDIAATNGYTAPAKSIPVSADIFGVFDSADTFKIKGVTLAQLKTMIHGSGTATFFAQATAPTGWTKSTTHNDKALRVVSGSGGGAGGTTAFSTVMASRTPAGSVNISGGTVGGHAITEAEMATHTHGVYDPGHTHTYIGRVQTPGSGQYGAATPYGTESGLATGAIGTGISIYAEGGNTAHSHPFTPPSGSFSGSAMDFAIQYVDVILCTKDA